VHEDGLPRWVAATDAAMELLEQVQHDFGEGPYLQAYAQDRPVGIEDLETAPTWVRIHAVVGQLLVRGVLSVPIRLAPGQPVGTVDVYSTHPRAWTTHELDAMGEFAAVAGELVHTAVELASHKLELAQLQQALTRRVWIEQAKGSWPPPRAPTPRRRSSSSDPAPGPLPGSWPSWPARSSRAPSVSGWPPWPWTTSGSERPKPAPRPPSRPSRPPRPT
jgi:hypothetical protein